MAGYSETPLAGKLGLKVGSHLVLIDAPKDYAALVGAIADDVVVESGISESTDIVHMFTTRRAGLQRRLSGCRSKLHPSAMVWVSWPKSARVATDVTEDVVREVALPLGFVDVKVCAVTDFWSGLKHVVRKEFR